MKEKIKYTIISISILLAGILLGYISGSTTGMYLQTSPTEPIKCVDTDPENNIYIYGEVILNGVVYPDKCVGNIIYEVYCGEFGNVRRLRERCDNDCLEGRCI